MLAPSWPYPRQRRMVFAMKTALLVCVCALFSGLSAQSDRLGKTSEEIVKMGLEKWVDFYWENVGRSEADTDRAHIVFANCQKEQNDALLPELNPSDRERISKYKPLFAEFRQLAVQITAAYARGGTLYTHALARGVADDEILFAKLIALNMKPVEWATAEKRQRIMDLYGWIRKDLGERCTITLERRAELEREGVDWRTIISLGSKAMRNLDKISPLLPRERQDECILVFEYYWNWLRAFRE